MYQDAFINAPLGANRINWLLQGLCQLGGVPGRSNHAVRRTFIQSCYRAGMPESAIMHYSRHTNLDGLRTYSG